MKHNIIATKDYLLVVNESEIGGESDYFYLGKKIIAHLPLNGSPILEGVDLLPPIEDDVEKLAEDYSKNHSIYDTAQDDVYHGFVKGYNAAKEKYKYTEDDLKKAIEMAQEESWDEGGYLGLEYKPEQIIQSLQQPKMPVGFECEIDLSKHNGQFQTKYGIKTITNPQGLTQWVGKYIYNK